MISRLELAIAWRYLRSRRGSRLLSFISVIAIGGIVVGVSALIVIIGVMNGLQHDLREKILVGSPDIRVLTYGEDLRISEWRGVLAKVRRQPGVVAAAPFVLSQALMRAGADYVEPVSIAGIEPAGTPGRPVTSIREHATIGDFRFATPDGRRRGAVPGKLLAERMNAFPGTKLTLFAPASTRPNAVTGGLLPRIVTLELEVTGVFETGMYEYDNQYVFVDFDAARELAGLDSAVTGIEVRTPSREEAPAVAVALADSLGFPYHTVDWRQQNSSLFKALTLEKLGMGVILSLIVIVAAFNIVSTLTMVVRDKTREIGILKAMGLPSTAVRRVFLAQGVVIGVVGTVLGLGLGVTTGRAIDRYRLITLDPQIYFIDHLPVRMQPFDIGLIVLLGVAIATLATLHPATQAARLYPIEAIRSE
ncbi:MAG TPA: ABC transporter permease [Gemmatimonadaceae bacterium]|nr:ABC transporter permease [Gemmatimonadaceae bacterium]